MISEEILLCERERLRDDSDLKFFWDNFFFLFYFFLRCSAQEVLLL